MLRFQFQTIHQLIHVNKKNYEKTDLIFLNLFFTEGAWVKVTNRLGVWIITASFHSIGIKASSPPGTGLETPSSPGTGLETPRSPGTGLETAYSPGARLEAGNLTPTARPSLAKGHGPGVIASSTHGVWVKCSSSVTMGIGIIISGSNMIWVKSRGTRGGKETGLPPNRNCNYKDAKSMIIFS